MNKDIKHGMAIGVAFASLVAFAMPAKSQDMISDLELCEKAVKYSVKYLPEEDGGKLHQARWEIIEGERTDDAQKLISLVVFEIGQRIGYSYDSEVHGEGTEWIEQQIVTMADACEEAIIDIRKSEDFGEFESANPDEAW